LRQVVFLLFVIIASIGTGYWVSRYEPPAGESE
jgi:hypothetical protein